MKKSLSILMAMFIAYGSIIAQCVPAGPSTVSGTFTANGIAVNTYNGVPTGNVIEINVTVPAVDLSIDLCGTNQGTPPFPNGDNDSYVTILNNNAGNATVVGDIDDGCNDVNAPGFGPSAGNLILTSGTYYLYVTEYDGTDPCAGNTGLNTYEVVLSSTEVTVPANDECNQAVALSVGTTYTASNIASSVNATVEGAGGNSIGIASPCNDPNGFELFNTVWFSFNAPAAGFYEMTINPTGFSGNFGFDIVFFPEADVSCTNINQTSFANAFCKTITESSPNNATVFNLPAAGNYLIPVSSYDADQFEFEITINTTTAAPSCASANAGTLVISPCTEATDTISFTYTGPFNIETVGYSSGFYEIIATQPITDFSQLGSNASVLVINPIDEADLLSFMFPAADFINNFSAGIFYFYLVAANDVYYQNNERVFNGSCMSTTGSMFEVKAAGESCIVGINDINALSGMEIYPNPATANLNVKLTATLDATYEIMNSTGIVVATGNLQTGVTAVDVASLSQGIYFISAKADKQQPVMQRFTVVR